MSPYSLVYVCCLLFVVCCLLVCGQYYTKTTERIFTKLGMRMCLSPE